MMLKTKVRLGLLLLVATTAWAAPQLFTNTGFESGLTGWNLVGADYNCVANKNAGSIPGCPDDPTLTPFAPRFYVRSGNQGMFLGYGDWSAPATLTQTVTLQQARYRVDFYYKEHDTYAQPVDNLLEVVFGPDLAHLTSAWSVVDVTQKNSWILQTVRFNTPAAGQYVVGFRFYNVWGEWALDDTSLMKNPEPGSFVLSAVPIAIFIWRLRRRGGVSPAERASAR